MDDAKYIGRDVHQAMISVAVLDSAGKLVMEAILKTKADKAMVDTLQPHYLFESEAEGVVTTAT